MLVGRRAVAAAVGHGSFFSRSSSPLAAVLRRGGQTSSAIFLLVCLALFRVGRQTESLPEVPKGGVEEVERFVQQHMEPMHAVAILSARKGTKRFQLLEELAGEAPLRFLLAFGVQTSPGSSLAVYRYNYPPEVYKGKWTGSALREWLQDNAYPLVNRMSHQFSPPKYLTTESPYGVVLVVKQLGEQDGLIAALEPYAHTYRHRLKFTFFTKAAGTQELCDANGILTNDELLILERPGEIKRLGKHSNVPVSAKFRLEGVTTSRLQRFFDDYAKGVLPRYFISADPRPTTPILQNGIRTLTSWDFAETVNDPHASVLVVFVSEKCDACDEFAGTLAALGIRLQRAKMKPGGHLLAALTLARIDQSRNEHAELVKGTPWLRYWPSGAAKRAMTSNSGARTASGSSSRIGSRTRRRSRVTWCIKDWMMLLVPPLQRRPSS